MFSRAGSNAIGLDGLRPLRRRKRFAAGVITSGPSPPSGHDALGFLTTQPTPSRYKPWRFERVCRTRRAPPAPVFQFRGKKDSPEKPWPSKQGNTRPANPILNPTHPFLGTSPGTSNRFFPETPFVFFGSAKHRFAVYHARPGATDTDLHTTVAGKTYYSGFIWDNVGSPYDGSSREGRVFYGPGDEFDRSNFSAARNPST